MPWFALLALMLVLVLVLMLMLMLMLLLLCRPSTLPLLPLLPLLLNILPSSSMRQRGSRRLQPQSIYPRDCPSRPGCYSVYQTCRIDHDPIIGSIQPQAQPSTDATVTVHQGWSAAPIQPCRGGLRS